MNDKQVLEMITLKDVRLSDFSHIRIGGSARGILAPSSVDELRVIMPYLSERGYLAVGGASNLLFPDCYDGYVLLDEKLPRDVTYDRGVANVTANVNVNAMLMKLAAQDAGGFEFLAGIPAHLGGVVKMNAGAYGKTLQTLIHSIEVLDAEGKRNIIPAERVKFGYRTTSIREYIVSVNLLPEEMDRREIKARVDELIAMRRSSQPLNMPNLGCIFKNPPYESAGKLIDECGLKGKRIGGAVVSDVHANFIVNAGGATYSDVLSLIDHIREIVLRERDIQLELEIEVVHHETQTTRQ